MGGLTLKRVLACGFDEALSRVPEALKGEGFGVLTEIDIAATLVIFGVDFMPLHPRRNPPRMRRQPTLMSADAAAASSSTRGRRRAAVAAVDFTEMLAARQDLRSARSPRGWRAKLEKVAKSSRRLSRGRRT
jgi:hypothetical protein